MFYTVYKTTCSVNGKTYIGVHKTEDPNDGYLGSGRLMAKAIKKHGRQAFKKEVLFVFDNLEDMWKKEAELVDLGFVESEDTYNLIPGGTHGDRFYQAMKSLTPEFKLMRARKASKAGTARLLELLKDDEFKSRHRNSLIRGVRERERKWVGEGQAWTGPKNFAGKTHSEETLAKMRAARAGQSSGSKNSQFGTAWVCKLGEKPRKVKTGELEKWLSEGWERGRVS